MCVFFVTTVRNNFKVNFSVLNQNHMLFHEYNSTLYFYSMTQGIKINFPKNKYHLYLADNSFNYDA